MSRNWKRSCTVSQVWATIPKPRVFPPPPPLPLVLPAVVVLEGDSMARDPKISEAMPFRLALWPLLPYSSQLPRVLSVLLLPSLLQSTARCLKEGILQALTKDSWGATDQVKRNTLLSLSVFGCLFLY